MADCFGEEPQVVPIIEKIGSVGWTIELVVRQILNNGDDPNTAALRKQAVRECEVLRHKDDVDKDVILDCFTDVEIGMSGGEIQN